jgi:hypothetical protein
MTSLDELRKAEEEAGNGEASGVPEASGSSVEPPTDSVSLALDELERAVYEATEISGYEWTAAHAKKRMYAAVAKVREAVAARVRAEAPADTAPWDAARDLYEAAIIHHAEHHPLSAQECSNAVCKAAVRLAERAVGVRAEMQEEA